MRLLDATGTRIFSGSSQLTVGPDFHNCGVNWTHSWDVLDAVLYTPGGPEIAAYAGYGVKAERRVEQIPDRVGGRPLYRDKGAFGQAYLGSSYLPLPGPQYIPNSKRFRGRPCVKFDQVHSTPLYAMLSPQTTLQTSSDYFNSPNGYAAPYWLAMLCRVPSLGGSLDSQLGSDRTISAGPTIGHGNSLGSGTDWSFACWYDPESDDPQGFIADGTCRSSHTQSADETVLLMCQIARGASAGAIYVYWRGADGIVTGTNANGTICATAPTTAWRELFMGWIDEHAYVSAFGIKTGTIGLLEIGNLIAWAAPWLPGPATLASEP